MELAIQGKGIPIGSTGMAGALFLHVQIRYPPAFSAMELHDLRAKLEDRGEIKEEGDWEETVYSEGSSTRFQCELPCWF